MVISIANMWENFTKGAIMDTKLSSSVSMSTKTSASYVGQEDLWDVYEGHFRYRKMDGAGKLTYNHSPLSWQDPSSDIAPPGGVGFRRRCSGNDGTKFEAFYFDEDAPKGSRVHMYGEPGDV